MWVVQKNVFGTLHSRLTIQVICQKRLLFALVAKLFSKVKKRIWPNKIEMQENAITNAQIFFIYIIESNIVHMNNLMQKVDFNVGRIEYF